jgi:tRNA dimethylallyltransferase
MDIGTGKITEEETKGVEHHLLDIASPKRTFTVAQYKRKADKAVHDILKRGNLPILCGGTGFYIQAVTDGVMLPEVKPNPLLRKQLAKLSTEELFTLLQKNDPDRAETIDAKNPRRLVRAIEISAEIGKVPALHIDPPYETLFIGIEVANDPLRERIHKRLLARMDQGMIEETERLHREGISWKRMENFGLEYRYLARHLQGKISRDEMLTELEREITHYAKRQYTWFRKNKRIQWIALGAIDSAKELTGDFLK